MNKRICANHPTAHWGDDQWGHPYPRCYGGKMLNQDCVELCEHPEIINIGGEDELATACTICKKIIK